MSNATPSVFDNPLSNAIRAAQIRTGRSGLGTQIRMGLWQVVDVTYPSGKRGRSIVTPLSGWIAGHEVIAALEAL